MERKRLELGVGLFLLLGLLCLAYLSIKLGNIHLFNSTDYKVYTTFTNVGGLKTNADVTMAGVLIGRVERVQLKKGQALVILNIHQDVRLEDDVIASIKTMGIIGDKYISISPGASDDYIKPGGTIQDTQPPLDIENLIGKFVFGSMEKEKTDKVENKEKADNQSKADKIDKKTDEGDSAGLMDKSDTTVDKDSKPHE